MPQSAAPINYLDMSKLQRLAIFLVSMGPEVASIILKRLPDTDVEVLCREIAGFSQVDAQLQRAAMDEFSRVLADSSQTLWAGSRLATKLLTVSREEPEVKRLSRKIAPPNELPESVKQIRDYEPRVLFNILRSEQPQVMAFVVSQLDMARASEFLLLLPNELRETVVEKLGCMQVASIELAERVVAIIKHNISDQKMDMRPVEGVKVVAGLLNSLKKDISKDLLQKIDERNPELAKDIRKKMFGFEDLVKLQLSDLQRIAREVEMSDLVTALKNASKPLQEILFSAVSKRAAQTIKDEMQMLGSVKPKEIEAAQDRIIQIVRRLEDEGEITLDASQG